MVGVLGMNFRFGNFAEHLGILLLKGVAAVAEVSRQEDVGLDAIATLLRRDADRNCYAEDTFVVQLKSESVNKIEYIDDACKWFVQQSLPMFVGRVSLARSEIALYPTIFANQAIWSLHAEAVTMRFGASQLPPMLREQLWSPWRLAEADEPGAEVWLGEPILRWTVDDLQKSEWAEMAYSVLKRFISLVRRELELLSFGQCSILEWSTNDAGSIKSRLGMMKGHSSDLISTAEKCTPALQALMLQSFSVGNDAGERMLDCLVELAAALRDAGIEIDPDKMFRGMFVALKARRTNSTATVELQPEN